ncbi:hypothetical protein ABXN37_15410 [Piscinibacter sakaiensis]|uniref:hypothetical protein n=1 Tax=Piscinibacter sakaiensis TaxID=1547922 RepID=UPI003726D4E0
MPLPARAHGYLETRRLATAGPIAVDRAWKRARRTQALGEVVRTLRSMAGPLERCMYCVDSHGSDIEHFWPKASYAERAFEWANLLLCCTECGRLKGDRFPLLPGGQAALVDPSAEDPWDHLDFDPDTGNLTARYDAASAAPSARGAATVKLLQLDRREAMTEGCRRTYRRLADRVRQALAASEVIDAEQLASDLLRLDDHGLLGWCFGPIGSTLEPFLELRRRDPEAARLLRDSIAGAEKAPA